MDRILPEALGYVRTASGNDHEGFDRQEAAIKTYARETGLELTDIFYDRGVAGTTVERPSLIRLLEICEQTPGTIVIVEHPDRLWRSMQCYATLFDKICRADATIRVTSSPGWDLRAPIFGIEPQNTLEPDNPNEDVTFRRPTRGL